MANSPDDKKSSPVVPAESAPRIIRFLVRMWGVVAALCKLYWFCNLLHFLLFYHAHWSSSTIQATSSEFGVFFGWMLTTI